VLKDKVAAISGAAGGLGPTVARAFHSAGAYGKSTPAREIAAAMLFLCSDEAATINGTRLPLTGRG
jgi:NAD(P)-dependent dehydrogenase (short-subunit alcohol dehydrogenase family)